MYGMGNMYDPEWLGTRKEPPVTRNVPDDHSA